MTFKSTTLLQLLTLYIYIILTLSLLGSVFKNEEDELEEDELLKRLKRMILNAYSLEKEENRVGN